MILPDIETICTVADSQIYVFKTNVHSHRILRALEQALAPFPNLYWSVDLDDEDRVLRVVSATLTASQIRQVAALAGIRCEELA